MDARISALLARIELTLEPSKRPVTQEVRNDFDAILSEEMSRRLPVPSQLAVQRCTDACRRGLVFARRGALHQSAVAFAEANVVRSGIDNAEAATLSSAFLHAAEAYLWYRRALYHEARNAVRAALRADRELGRLGKYPVMHMHSVQLLHNLARISAREGSTGEARDLSTRILRYLQGMDTEFHEDGGVGVWSPGAIASVDERLVDSMREQVCAELVPLLDGERSAVAVWVSECLACHPKASVGSSVPAQWWRTKVAFAFGSALEHLECAVEFLEQPLEETSALARSVLVDVWRTCGEISQTEALQLREAIVTHARSWRGATAALGSLSAAPMRLLAP